MPNDSSREIMSKLAAAERGNGCSETVYAYFADNNEYGRYQPNSSKVGHALVSQTSSGALQATQYALPQAEASTTSKVNRLTNIKLMVRGRRKWLRAKDEEQTRYISKRHVQLQDNPEVEPSDLYYLSPYEYDSSDDGSEFSDNDSDDGALRNDLTPEQQAIVEQIDKRVKHRSVTLNPEDLRKRDENPSRNITQKAVMGQSAKEILVELLTRWHDFLSPERLANIDTAIKASHKYFPENEFSLELLHLIAHSLSLTSNKPEDDPQQPSNMGAASKWANTEMMLLERIEKWLGLSEPDAKITPDNFFEMLLGTEAIEKIHQEVIIELKGRWVRLINAFNVWKTYPAFSKCTDLAQTLGILDAIFNRTEPAASETIEVKYLDPKVKTDMPKYNALESLNDEVDESVSSALKQAVALLSKHPDFRVCRRIRDRLSTVVPDASHYLMSVVDLETSGLDAEDDDIIQIYIEVLAVCKRTQRIVGVVDSYESLNQPKKPISSDITRLTGITNEALENNFIQWELVHGLFLRSRYLLGHNMIFDIGFLKRQTPDFVQACLQQKAYACTLADINWYKRGFDPRKLDFLNYLLGYFIKDAHQAKSDVEATYNMLLDNPGLFEELLENARRRELYGFSRDTLGKQVLAPMPKLKEHIVHETLPSPDEVEAACALLSQSTDYQLFKAVPMPDPIRFEAPSRPKPMTIVTLKTSHEDPRDEACHITGVALLSFTMDGEAYIVSDVFADERKDEEHDINWSHVASMLLDSQCLITDKYTTRKWLEKLTPFPVQSRVRALPCLSMDSDIDWKQRGIANTQTKYVSFTMGFFFEYDNLRSKAYGVYNILKSDSSVFQELSQKVHHAHRVILATGPCWKELRNEKKMRIEMRDLGFRWSDGSGAMGQGWWTCVEDAKAQAILDWLTQKKATATESKGEIFSKRITANERYSERAEYKAKDMREKPKRVSAKRPRDDDNEPPHRSGFKR